MTAESLRVATTPDLIHIQNKLVSASFNSFPIPSPSRWKPCSPINEGGITWDATFCSSGRQKAENAVDYHDE